MAVHINFKICDNSKECGGLDACPSGAIFWDDKNRTLAIDSAKCISCGLCVEACELGAIKVSRNKDEYEKIENEIATDPRKLTDLFVDRYGAQPVLNTFLIEEEDFNLKNLEGLNAIELFNDDSIQCLLKSIPISELLDGFKINYIRVKLSNTSLEEGFGVKKLPAMLFLRNNKLIGKVEGYFDSSQKTQFREDITRILKGQM